ncbi:MAG TPA: response regulator transcription factor [Nitrospira sp.]|nr:response regulator transcription factor [Nitrospira sp.]
MKRALVIDDHPIVRDGIRDLLQHAFPSLDIEVSSGREKVAETVCGSLWAFVILDINLPGQNGIDVLKQARGCCPDVPIFIFSMFSERQYADRALRAGAVAYVSKDQSPIDLIQAVKQALRGGRDQRKRESIGPVLSDREMQVLAYFANGMRGNEIARQLGIDAKTVSTYKSRLLQKLDVRNFAELIRYASEEGLVE